MVTGIGKVTWKIHPVTHPDDTTLLVTSKDDLIELMKWLKKQWKGGS